MPKPMKKQSLENFKNLLSPIDHYKGFDTHTTFEYEYDQKIHHLLNNINTNESPKFQKKYKKSIQK